jgi:hypothetical protein
MMKLSKKTKYALIGLLVILNIILRLPVTPHEIGIDSFHTHTKANFISTTGYADWILSPLSFFGLYPLSYPSGEIFLLSGLSQCSSIEMEWIIWVAATFFGAFVVFTSYLMAKEINNDFLFAFSVASIYSLSRIFITFTNWTVSTRALFITILPLFIWSLLRSHNQKEDRLKYLLFSVGLLIILSTLHRMVFFTPLILIAFGISLVGKKFKVPKIASKTTVILFFTLFIPLFLLPFTPLGFYHELESFIGGHPYGYFFHGSTPYHIILNMSAEYAMAVGILVVLVPIGLIVLLLKKQKTFSDVFLLALVLCFAPFLADPTYMRFFVLFIFSLLIGFGLAGIIKMLSNVEKVKSITPLILVIILLFSALLPYFAVVRPVPSLPYHTSHMNELTYDAALFIKAHGVELPRICPSIRFSPQINAIAGPPYQHSFSSEIDKIGSWSIEPISLSSFETEFSKYKNLYVVKKPRYGYFWYFDCDDMNTKRAFGNKTYLAIEDNYLPSHLPFYVSTRATKPKIYDNGLESIWYLSY